MAGYKRGDRIGEYNYNINGEKKGAKKRFGEGKFMVKKINYL